MTKPRVGQRVTVSVEGCVLPPSTSASSLLRGRQPGEVLATEVSVDVHEKAHFVIGDCEVVDCWEIAVQSMTVGQKSHFISGPRFAYGEEGR